ncbi:hypothetical protein GGTG_01503 [Gaeumannomyces tritici R3-111a-1]|uniref:RING-type E3 ubiquitin transferase n=1 Tax=Gaeumannomyces tritici (strain R3-111a-1) TaxID=644352 RepID=J3NJS3_GAET3|nr:hypothetical protein GGTG_01503 [Gaeumannomyces tritici R3-111a-1]EJT81525.1 hypothetical protein GGTG_01503 [Gaeumannomyces tritici R3-111a-1]
MAAPTGARPPPPEPSPFPYAAAPDIIRAHQKDAYFSGVLTNQLTDLHRRLLGARSAHAWAGPARQAADVAYLALTTLIGNRTLGEEYCDLLQVESEPALPLPFLGDGAGYNSRAPRLPSVARRAAYIVASILVPHLFSRLLPSIRGVLRRRLEARLRTLAARAGRAASSAPAATATTTATPTSSLKKSSPQKTAAPAVPLEARIERYILEHLPVLTSGAPWQAAALTAFYFGGAYYNLAKRAVGLRYIFTRNVTGGPAAAGRDGRGGYEILGVLMVVQFAIQAYLHARSVLASPAPSGSSSSPGADELAATHHHHHAYGVEVSLDHEHSFASNNGLLLFPGELAAAGADGSGAGATAIDVPRATHTPVAPAARYDLSRGGPAAMMGWIKGQHQRKCTLCLDEMRDPAATSCGHVFCWSCIGDWVREKPECPLCRREALVQHILPLRAALAA